MGLGQTFENTRAAWCAKAAFPIHAGSSKKERSHVYPRRATNQCTGYRGIYSFCVDLSLLLIVYFIYTCM